MNWNRFKKYFYEVPNIGFSIDISRMNFSSTYLKKIESRMFEAYQKMQDLENGSIVNIDENKMVGHYWLRNSHLAPTIKIKKAIEENIKKINFFYSNIQNKKIIGEKGPFENMLIIGIGGSALGPQLLLDSLININKDEIKSYFLDNTDPDGIDSILSKIGNKLGKTLVIVISKSGKTIEIHNGILEVKNAYQKLGLNFSKHAIAITDNDSYLGQIADKEQWICQFPLWEWIGGRTSIFSSVGLVPAIIQGINIDQLLEGSKYMDNLTRDQTINNNPAALLALMWYKATKGKGAKDMVIIPYKDRLDLFTKYLQQLIMESLGKEKNFKNQIVNQGISVYGNKGSTDQHSYVQQLRDGVNNFFVTFIEVLKDREGTSINIKKDITTGDYLNGFLLGTRDALKENNRESITITIKEISPFNIGLLVALYERAVGFYATLIDVNAYNQPGVEAGKKASQNIIEIQEKIYSFLKENKKKFFTVKSIAKSIRFQNNIEKIFKILEHLEANPDKKIIKIISKSLEKRLYSYNES